MPYIKESEREQFDAGLDLLEPATPGQLNYIISVLVNRYLGDNPDYTRYNTIVGVMRCALAEFERTRLFPYEDLKRAENGDVL